MPFRLNEFRTTIRCVTNVEMPSMIYKACLKTDTISNTRYIQVAICEALARDLDIPLEDLLAKLPESRSNAKTLWGDDRKAVPKRTGPANTVESVG